MAEGGRCFWCNTDPAEAAARHEGPHATWCCHYRRPPLPPGVYRDAAGGLHHDGPLIDAQPAPDAHSDQRPLVVQAGMWRPIGGLHE